MRMFGLIGIVLALLIVGVLAKRQMSGTTVAPFPAAGASAPSARAQSQQLQQNIQQSLDAAMRQPRPEPDGQ